MKLTELFKRIIILYTSLFIFSASAYGQNSDSSQLRVELREVEIIGQRTPAVYNNIAREISVISNNEIKTSPSATIQDLLEYVPFADIRQRNIHGVQADIQFRGGTFDQVMVMLNGINITDPQTGHFNLDLPVDLSSIERIEVLHGSGARLYGANAYKGVINFITKKDQNLVSTGLSYGQYGLLRASATAGVSNGKIFNNISFSRNTSGGFTENTDYSISNLFYNGGITRDRINVQWQAGSSGKAFGANDFYTPSFADQYEETSSRFAGIILNTMGKIKVSATGSWRRHNDHFLLKRNDPAFYENFHRTDIIGSRINATFKSFLGKTSFGLESRYEGILSSALGNDMNLPVKIYGSDKKYSKSYSRFTSGIFSEHNYTLNNFSATGGLLVNINSDQDKISLFPGMDISYKLFDQKFRLFASVNRSLRLPTFTDMFYNDPANEGNAALIPEKLLAFEAGTDLNLNNYTAGVTLFRDMGKDVIDWAWDPGLKKYMALNITEITTRGIEFRSEIKLSHLRSFSIDKIVFSYAYIDLKKSTPGYESKYSLDHLKHKVQIGLSQKISTSIGAEWRLSYYNRNGTYLDYDTSSRTLFSSPFKPYILADTRIWYRTGIFTAHIDVSNLFDAKYTDTGNLIQPGRWLTAGIQLNFALRNR